VSELVARCAADGFVVARMTETALTFGEGRTARRRIAERVVTLPGSMSDGEPATETWSRDGVRGGGRREYTVAVPLEGWEESSYTPECGECGSGFLLGELVAVMRPKFRQGRRAIKVGRRATL